MSVVSKYAMKQRLKALKLDASSKLGLSLQTIAQLYERRVLNLAKSGQPVPQEGLEQIIDQISWLEKKMAEWDENASHRHLVRIANGDTKEDRVLKKLIDMAAKESRHGR